jgi:hypothetical protein
MSRTAVVDGLGVPVGKRSGASSSARPSRRPATPPSPRGASSSAPSTTIAAPRSAGGSSRASSATQVGLLVYFAKGVAEDEAERKKRVVAAALTLRRARTEAPEGAQVNFPIKRELQLRDRDGRRGGDGELK